MSDEKVNLEPKPNKPIRAIVNLSSNEKPFLREVELISKYDIPRFIGFYLAYFESNEAEANIIVIHRDQIVSLIKEKEKIQNEKQTDTCNTATNPS